jgi:hypothetical protein
MIRREGGRFFFRKYLHLEWRVKTSPKNLVKSAAGSDPTHFINIMLIQKKKQRVDMIYV